MSGTLLATAFLFGAMLGSLANVLIHRVPRGQSIVAPPSYCPACGGRITAPDNIPILSFLLLGGRCRRCRARIPPRYLVAEAAMGLVAAALVARFGITFAAFRFGMLAFLLLVAAWTDLEHRTVPNAVTYPGTVLGLVCSTVVGDGVSAVVGALAAAAVFLAVAVISRGGVGGGDVKLAIAVAAWVGLDKIIWFALATAVGGGLVAAACYLLARPSARAEVRTNLTLAALGGELPQIPTQRTGHVSVPYALAIAAGAAVALLVAS